MFGYYIAVWEKFAVFSGRARRAEYWYFCLANLIVGFVLGLIEGFTLGLAGSGRSDYSVSWLSNVYSLVILIPSIAVGVRRMHDVDKSGWFLLVPFYNLYLSIQPGTVGPNRFGPDPKITEVAMPMPTAAANTSSSVVPPAPPTSAQ
jgi:uncharacterized membrane protein YhaH (DUF805 family)